MDGAVVAKRLGSAARSNQNECFAQKVAASKTTGSAFCIIRHYLLPPEQYKVHSIGLCEAGMIPSKPFPSLQLLHIPGAQCISTTKNHLKHGALGRLQHVSPDNSQLTSKPNLAS
ncbi:unnamed protein product [Alternaria burnsii]|nr:unnamed protein product [Alternaria burnsii]